MNKITILLVITLFLSPLSGCTSDEEAETVAFPAFSQTADNGETYDNARMSGAPYIVIFSAEWCNNPCYTTMHAIWNTIPETTVLVMSTDPVENAGGFTLSEWHESANAHDDNDDNGDGAVDESEEGVSLTTYAFMKGSDAGQALDITKPGSVVFVNGEGEVTFKNEGRMDDSAEIQAKWDEASA